jgi:SGNH hydrolase-like domain, acetyltransferase AlgX
MRTWINRIFVGLFVALCAAPLLQMVTHLIHEPLVEERRQPQPIAAPWPRLAAMDPSLSGDVNRWFDDRYGFRSVLIRLHNEVDYQLFGVSDKVLIGRDGWLFEKDFVDDVVADAHNAALEGKVLDVLRGLRDCLAQRDIKLVFVLNATKGSIDPQLLPARLPLDPPPRLSRRIAAALGREPGITFIDGERILRQHDGEELFYQTDVHLNLKASAYVYRDMVAQIARVTARSAPVLPEESWSTIDWDGGSEARFLAKLLPLHNVSYVTPTSRRAFKSDANGAFEEDIGNAGIANPPGLPLFDLIFKNKRPAATLLPPMMLFGTSFSDGFFDLTYNDAFAAVYQTRSNVPERIGPLLHELPGDVAVFVLEFPEPYLSLIPRLGDLRACKISKAQ